MSSHRQSAGWCKIISLFVLMCVYISAVGCGSGRYPVAGTVTLDGQPLQSGEVTLYPDGDGLIPSDQIPSGEIGPDGRFSISTRDGYGVQPGKYRVVVRSSTSERPKNVPANPVGYYSRIDKKYTERLITPLRIEVVENPSPGAYDLTLNK